MSNIRPKSMGGLSALPTDFETPRTDLAEENLRAVGGAGYVPASHARELERELNNAAANYNLCHENLGREVVKCGQLASDNKNLMSEIRTLQDALSNLRNWCELNGWDISTSNRAQTIANQELAQERGEESDAATETANRGRAV